MESLENQILIYISEHTIVHPKDVKYEFEKRGFSMERTKSAITEIDTEGFITTARGKVDSFCLTKEGKKALKMGFGKYMQEKEREAKRDNRIKVTTLWANYINITSAIWGAGGFILGILTKDRLVQLWEWLSTFF